jgi:predicted O-methyltransferase YrrM
MSETILGWREGAEARALAMAVYELAPNPTIVEVGVFMGRGTVLLAGARRLRGDGRVDCVDPFDCSGDDFSVPYYLNGLSQIGAASLEDVFLKNMKQFSLECMVTIHKGTSRQIASMWCAPIDLLVLDADQSRKRAQEAFDSWVPFVKPGGIVVLSNSGERVYAPTHDGYYLLAKKLFKTPSFKDVYCVMYTTFGTKELV